MKYNNKFVEDKQMMLDLKTQNVVSAIKHGSLNPVLHLGLLFGQFFITTRIYGHDFESLFEFNFDKSALTRTEMLQNNCEYATASLHQVYYTFIILHCLCFIFQTLTIMEYHMSHQLRMALSVLNLMFSVLYHLGIVMMIVRNRQY